VTLRVVILVLGVVAFAAGCSSGSSGGAAAQSTASTVTTPAPTPTHTHAHTHAPASPTPTPTPTATVTVTAAAAATQCRSVHLGLTLGISQGTAGTSYQTVVFTNHGTAACTLFGYPGVSYVDAGGALIGKPASEDAGKKKTITLAPGGQANALLRQPEAGNFPPSSCHQTTADRLRVYPPGERKPLFVPDAVQVCSTATGRAGIGPVLAGNGG
jgi:Protein of unknown function (DUF4232)